MPGYLHQRIHWLLWTGLLVSALAWLKWAHFAEWRLSGLYGLLLLGSALAYARSGAWRLALPGLALFLAPRLGPVSLGYGHNTLAPLFLGFCLALLLGQRSRDESGRPGPTRLAGRLPGVIGLLMLWLWLSILWHFRALWTGGPLEAAPGVSSNYAAFLSLDLALQLGPVLLFVSLEVAPLSRLWLMRGLALGGLASAAVALLQGLLVYGDAPIWLTQRLFVGTARSLEAGRSPGLASNASASSILFPVGLAALLFVFLHSPSRRPLPERNFRLVFQRPLAQLALASVGFPVLAVALRFQGKTALLCLPGLGLLIVWSLAAQGRTRDDSRLAWIRWTALALAVAFLAFAVVTSLSVGPTAWQSAVAASTNSRLLQLEAAWLLFVDSPWIGHGLNSFLVAVRTVESSLPGLEVDNAPGLIPAMAVDLGLAGILLTLLVAILYLRGLRGLRGPVERFLYGLPLAIGPSFLVGQQLVLPEIAALTCLALLGARASRRASGGLLPATTAESPGD